MKKIFALTAAATLLAGVSGAQVILTTDFETDPSANFTVATSSADTEAIFTYDYSTWAPSGSTAGITSIPAAPSGAGTRGLKMRANFDVGATNEGVTAFITGGTGISDWVLTFDAFQLWNGPADVSGSGTTTSMTIGNSLTTRPHHTAPTDFTGWFVLMTPEGGNGASGDVRYYSATAGTPAVDLAKPNWVGPTNMPSSPSVWDNIFATPNYPLVGSPGRQWVTWEVKAEGGNIVISVTPVGGTKTQIASWADATNRTPGIGFFDVNTGSVADPAADNFVVIDNLTLTQVSAADNWALYQ